MADFSEIIQEINTNLPDNTTQSITAAKLRTTLIDLTNTIDAVQDDYEEATTAQVEAALEGLVVDNLNSSDTDKALSANQGKILNGKLSIEQVGFELGTLNNITGAYLNSTTRVRCFPIYVGTGSIGTYTINIDVPLGISNRGPCVGYNGTPSTSTYVKNIATLTTVNVSAGTITIALDGTFDTVVVCLTKPDNSEITSTEVSQCFVLNTIKDVVLDIQESISESLTQNDIVNDLTTGGTDKALSAQMGKELAESLAPIAGPSEITIDFSYFTETGGISTGRGAVSGASNKHTDFIPINGNVTGTLTYNAKYDYSTNSGIAFYSSNSENSFLSPVVSAQANRGANSDKTIDIPEGAKYFRACGASGAYVKYDSIGGSIVVSLNEIDNITIKSASSKLTTNPVQVIKETPGLTAIFHRICSMGGSTSSGTVVNTLNSNKYDWAYIACIGRMYGADVENFGVGGMSAYAWLTNESVGALSSKWINDDPRHLYLVQFGANDQTTGDNTYVPGTIDDVLPGQEWNAPNSFFGKMSQVIATIKRKDPRCKIFVANYSHGYRDSETFPVKDVARYIPSKYSNVFTIDVDTYGKTMDWYKQHTGWEGVHPVGASYQMFACELATYIDWIVKTYYKKFYDVPLIGTDADLNGQLLAEDGGGTLACYQVIGTITHNGDNVSDAQITFVGSNPAKDYYANEFYVSSNENGAYAVKHIPADTYTVRVHTDSLDYSSSVGVLGNTTLNLSI